MPYARKFDGKLYAVYESSRKKKNAEARADVCRRKGWSARVVKGVDHAGGGDTLYTVYVRRR